MRLAAAFVLLCAAATADWDAAHDRFREAYRADGGAEQRKRALLDVAKEDVPEAAALVVGIYEDLEREAAKRRKALFKLRDKMAGLRAKARDLPPAKRGALAAKLDELQADELKEDGRLAAIEIEQSAILDGMIEMRSVETIAWLAKDGLDAAEASALRATIAARVARAPGAGVAALLDTLARVRDADRVIPLLQALGEKGAHADEAAWTAALPAILGHLEHRDWAVRVAAAWALAASKRPDGAAALVPALAKEKAQSRARREIGRALAVLTGQDFGEDADLWARWWADHGARVRSGDIPLGKGTASGAAKADEPRFYGIPQVGKRILYVLDVSGSMIVSMRNPQWIDGAAVSARDDEDSRYDAAVRELLRAVRSLPRDASYAVVLYQSHVVPLHDELVPATKENHAELERALAHTGPAGSTNIYAAMDHALRLANVHPDSKGDAVADVIYLISDGSPTDSKGGPEDPDRVIDAVRSWNAHRRVAIHTIGIGAEHNAGLLQTLAHQNGGAYYPVRPPRNGKR